MLWYSMLCRTQKQKIKNHSNPEQKQSADHEKMARIHLQVRLKTTRHNLTTLYLQIHCL